MENQDSNELETVVQRARDLVRDGRLLEGLKVLEDATGDFPDDATLEFEKAHLLAWKIPGEGLWAVKEYQKRFPGQYHGPILEAYCLIELRRARAALRCLGRAEALGAPESETREFRVRALQLAGQRRSSEKIVSDNEDLRSVKSWLATFPPQSEEALEDAVKRLRSAGELPEDVAAYRADWLFAKGRYQECSDLLREALERFPDVDYLIVRLAKAEVRLKHYDEAERVLRSHLERRPESVLAMNSLAAAAFRRGNFILALKRLWLVVCYSTERKSPPKL